MIDELLVSATPYGVRTALIADGEVVALNAESAGAPTLLENLYLAAPAHGGGAARFVSIGKERNALLQSAGDEPLSERVIVQVSRTGWDGKAPRVVAEPALSGRYTVYFPLGGGTHIAHRVRSEAKREELLTLARELAGETGCGLTIRSAAENADEALIRSEFALQQQRWKVIAAKRAQLAAPALLERGIGLVERLIRDVLPASAHIATDDKGMLTRLEAYIQTWVPDFVGRLELAADALFERHDAAGALAAALRPEVPLSGGGKLTIEPTTALTAIDVDCGLRSGAKRNALHTASIEAAAVAAEEIRRRNLVGMIVIDFPRPGDAASGEALVAEMRNRMSCDPVAHRVAGISASGLMEVTRRRGEMPLLDVLTEKRANGYGGRRPRLDALAFDAACAARLEVQAGARQVTLLAAPELAGYLRAVNPEAASADYVSLGTWLNAGVTVREDPAQRREDWAIEVD